MYSSMVFSNDLDLLEIKFIFFCNVGPEEVKCELPDQLPATKVSPNKAKISLVLSRNKIVSPNKLLAISKWNDVQLLLLIFKPCMLSNQYVKGKDNVKFVDSHLYTNWEYKTNCIHYFGEFPMNNSDWDKTNFCNWKITLLTVLYFFQYTDRATESSDLVRKIYSFLYA